MIFFRKHLFALIVLAQLGVPAAMILNQEVVLRTGEQVFFRAQPVDPYDIFRGRYLMLGFEEERVPVRHEDQWSQGEIGYVVLTKGPGGFAKVNGLSRQRPAGGLFVKVQVVQTDLRFMNVPPPLPLSKEGIAPKPEPRPAGYEALVRYPFSQYFLAEGKALQAEELYRRYAARDKRDAYLAVRIKNGVAATEDLFLEGKPIQEFLRK